MLLLSLAYIAVGSHFAVPAAPDALKAALQRLSSAATAVAQGYDIEAVAGVWGSVGLGGWVLRGARQVLAGACQSVCAWISWSLDIWLMEGPHQPTLLRKVAYALGGAFMCRKLVSEKAVSTEAFGVAEDTRRRIRDNSLGDGFVFVFACAYAAWFVPFASGTAAAAARVCLGGVAVAFGSNDVAKRVFGARSDAHTHLFNVGARLIAWGMFELQDHHPLAAGGAAYMYAAHELMRWSLGAEALLLSPYIGTIAEPLHLTWISRTLSAIISSV